MNYTLVISIATGVFFLALVALLIRRKTPKKLNTDLFVQQWKELQLYCKDKKTWSQALSEADKLLDTALKKRRFKGKSMGERLVSAQRVFTNNDSIWFAHNLYKKAAAGTNVRLKEADVKSALVAFRQALKDIGALPSA